jgi:hypothetical protein
MAAEITVFHSLNGPLSKQIGLDDDGKLKSVAACAMAFGTARRVALNGVASLAKLIGAMRSDEMLALGRMRPGLPDEVRIIVEREIDETTPADTIARTGDNLVYAPGQPGYMLLDHDHKVEIAAELKKKGGFWSVLTALVPSLAEAAYVYRGSTSAGLYHRDTGERLSQSENAHVYVAIQDGADFKRALKSLHDRLWLAGYGYFVICKAGRLLERSIVDAAVYGAERPVFEGPPILLGPVAQDAEARRPRVHKGKVIDTAAVIPSPT